MWKKALCALLPWALLSASLPASELPVSSFSRISEILGELEGIQSEKELYYQSLENTNEERKAELEQRVAELSERENELLALKRNLELFGDLIDDQAAYCRSLQKKLTFWRLTSGILAAALTSTIMLNLAGK